MIQLHYSPFTQVTEKLILLGFSFFKKNGRPKQLIIFIFIILRFVYSICIISCL